MAKTVQMWKSNDGKIFETRAAADAHDEAVKTLRNIFSKYGDEEKSNFYQPLFKILLTHTLVPRVYPEEPNHD